MVTEFTKLNHSIITPIMKSKGFQKIGRYEYGSTFDKAVYHRDNLEVYLFFSIHPYDYPYHGVEIKINSDGNQIQQKHYLIENSGLKSIFKKLADDLTNERIKGV